MKVRGFGAWPSRNVGKGGQTHSFDAYNKALKGGERFPRAEEYAGSGVEEYHHYQEQQDLTVEQNDDQAKKKKQQKDAKKRRQRMVQQFVVLVAGSIVVVSAYQAQAAKRAQQEGNTPPSTVATTPDRDATDATESPTDATQPTQDATADTTAASEPTTAATTAADQSSSTQSSSTQSSSTQSSSTQSSSTQSSSSQSTTTSWNWSANNAGATLVITDSAGNVVSEVAATVTTKEEPASCRTEGKTTYTASASANGETYSDTRYETRPALGHTFNDGAEVTLANGQTAMEYECTRCHEHFTIVNSIDEE